MLVETFGPRDTRMRARARTVRQPDLALLGRGKVLRIVLDLGDISICEGKDASDVS